MQRGQDWGIQHAQKWGQRLKHVVLGALFKKVVWVRKNGSWVTEDIPKGTELTWGSTLWDNSREQNRVLVRSPRTRIRVAGKFFRAISGHSGMMDGQS